MVKYKYLFFLVPFLAFICSFNTKKKEINWITFNQLIIAYNKNPKPIIIDVYTDWCGWCKVMEKETYKNEKVISYINDNYYAIKFNAESRDSINFNEKKYGYNVTNKVNDLALFLLFGRLGYPTTVLLSTIKAQPAPLAGYLKPSQLEAPVKYFGDGFYKNKNFKEYSNTFISTW